MLAHVVELYCTCGESFCYPFATQEATTEARTRWNTRHCGVGHAPVGPGKWKRLMKEKEKERVEVAKQAAGTFGFMNEKEKEESDSQS